LVPNTIVSSRDSKQASKQASKHIVVAPAAAAVAVVQELPPEEEELATLIIPSTLPLVVLPLLALEATFIEHGMGGRGETYSIL
jgi:hypothetical protein